MANSAVNGNYCQGVMVFDLPVPQKVFIWTCEFLKSSRIQSMCACECA